MSANSKKQVSNLSNNLIRSSVHLAVLAALAAGGVATQAQAQQAPVDNTPIQEVIVTGSLIKRPSSETTESVTIVTADSLKDQGITTIEEAVQQISAAQSGAFQTGSTVTWYSGGGSFADLRGLGPSKTLILLDGQRLANNVTAGNSVDLNGIPFAAIDHIEVLKEGASSLYGSDAIGGVINFITKKDYNGGEVNVNAARPQGSGGAYGNVDFTFGHGNLATDGYNILFTANYTQNNELTASQRSFAATGSNPALGLLNQNGLGTTPGSYIDGNGNIYNVDYPACPTNPHLTTFNGDCAYLYTAAVDLIPKNSDESAMLEFTKTVPGNNTVAIQYFYARTQITSWGGPITYGFNQSPTSPYFPTAAQSSCYGTCTPAAPDLTDPVFTIWTDPGNNRYNGFVNTEQRALLTFAGTNAGWDYATSFDYSKNHNDFKAVGGQPDLSVIGPGGTFSNAINPFGPQSAAGQALINSAYLNGPLATGALTLWSLNGHASHELGDAFNAGSPAAVAVGYDVRGESIEFLTTPLAVILQPAVGYPPTDVQGARTLQALYMELNVPVSKELEFTVSDREDRYSDFGETNNGKIAIRYQPFNFLTFRGTASTGFRAPALTDLYSPNTFGATQGTIYGPPCVTGAYTTIFSAENCVSQGLTLLGGNANLKPESSENFDLGMVVEPFTDMGITLDYYRIIIKNEIQSIPSNAIYANPTTFADLYVLNNTGTLTESPFLAADCTPSPPAKNAAPTCGYIIQTVQNTGGISTSGLDLNVQYQLHTGIGKFRVALDGTLVTKYDLQEYQGGPEVNLDGVYNQGNEPVIKWQDLLTIDWTLGNWGAGLSNKIVSSYVDENLLNHIIPTNPAITRDVGTYSIWDGYVSWKPIAPLSLVFGIRNLLNTDPPFSNQTADWQSEYNPRYSDAEGRTFYTRIKYQF
jgi:iron complex outermembrane receptor protein